MNKKFLVLSLLTIATLTSCGVKDAPKKDLLDSIENFVSEEVLFSEVEETNSWGEDNSTSVIPFDEVTYPEKEEEKEDDPDEDGEHTIEFDWI